MRGAGAQAADAPRPRARARCAAAQQHPTNNTLQIPAIHIGLGNAATFAVLLVALWVLMSARSACELKQGAGSSGSSVAGGRAEGSLRIWRGFGSSSGTSSSEAAANLLKPAPPPGAAAAATAALPAAAASSPALVDLSLAHRLLPLTNLSSLTTAALLDAHPGLSPAEARELVRLQQELHCRAVAGQPDPPGTRRIPFGNGGRVECGMLSCVSDLRWRPAACACP